jgi:hypothetical protein
MGVRYTVVDLVLAPAWRAASEIAPAAPPPFTIAFAGLGVALVLVLGLWEIAGHASTIAHEGAHAVVMLLTGEGVRSVEIDYENGAHKGATAAVNDRDTVLSWIVGYSGPSLFGLLGAALLMHGSATAVLWIYLVLLGLLLVVVRNVFGFLLVVATGAIFYLTVTYGSAAAQVLVACAWVWLLLLVGVVYAFDHFRSGIDYIELKRITWLPRAFWGTISIAVSLITLYVAGAWLLGFSRP